MRKITQDEFNKAVELHQKWRNGEDGGERADFSQADLTEVDFSYLSGADLSEANLRGADLSEANLSEAYLSEADLREAYLSEADLRGANLRGAYLRGADLSEIGIDDMEEVPESLWAHFAKDILYVLLNTRSEVPGLRKLLIEGKVSGTTYEGECCCLVGSLNNVAQNGTVDHYCERHIPFYMKGLHNPCETWFYQIRTGDTPENSIFSRKVVELIDRFFPEATPKQTAQPDAAFGCDLD